MSTLRKVLTSVMAAGIVLLVQAGAASAVPLYGIEVEGAVTPAPPPEGPGIELGGCTTFINFDDAEQPCFFSSTTALRNAYQGLGVLFSGPGQRDGGAILDECGNFGVNGHSSPNFLAFNCTATMADGGIPVGPETISLANAASSVSALVGTGGSGSLSMQAYDVNNQLLDTDTVAIGPTMRLISVAAPGIRSVVVGATQPCIWVLDDLCIDAGATPVESATWGAVKAVFK